MLIMDLAVLIEDPDVDARLLGNKGDVRLWVDGSIGRMCVKK